MELPIFLGEPSKTTFLIVGTVTKIKVHAHRRVLGELRSVLILIRRMDCADAGIRRILARRGTSLAPRKCGGAYYSPVAFRHSARSHRISSSFKMSSGT
jgi:hypothetical protein